MDNFEKQRIAIRYWLLGKGWNNAERAMGFAAAYHTGKRRGGDPEFSHQVSIAHYLRTLPLNDVDKQNAIAAAFLHDVVEDYNVPLHSLDQFGTVVKVAVDALSKKVGGQKKSMDEYYRILGCSRIGSLVKGGDRIHNFSTMVSVFTREGQIKYVTEAKEHIIPMLKQARENFRDNELAYENIKRVLWIQVDMIERILALSAPEVKP